MPPETRYAQSGEVSIAYQVVGDGPLDLVFVPGFVSHLDLQWRIPRVARFLDKLASFSRLILLNKRVVADGPPSRALEQELLGAFPFARRLLLRAQTLGGFEADGDQVSRGEGEIDFVILPLVDLAGALQGQDTRQPPLRPNGDIDRGGDVAGFEIIFGEFIHSRIGQSVDRHDARLAAQGGKVTAGGKRWLAVLGPVPRAAKRECATLATPCCSHFYSMISAGRPTGG